MEIKNFKAVAVATAALFSASGLSVQAAVKTWTGTTNATWATGANWGGTAPVTGDSLVFTSATGAGGLTLSDNLMTPGTFNVAGITFNAGSGAYVINPATSGTNGLTLTGNILNSSTSLQTINDLIATTAVRTVTMTTGGGNVTLGGNISGTAGGLTTAGTGRLTLSGTNTYTGATTVAANTILQLNSAAALSSSTALTLQNGSTLALRGDSNTTFTAASLANTPNGSITIDVNQLSTGTNNTLTLSNNFTTTPTSTINVTGGNGYTLGLGTITGAGNAADGTFNVASGLTLSIAGLTGNAGGNDGFTFTGSGDTSVGVITEAAATNRGMSLTKNGSGSLTLTGANNLRNNNTGTSVVTLNSGTLNLANAAALSTGTGTGTNLVITGGTLDATGGVTALTFGGNAVTQNWNGNFTFTGTNSLNMGTGAVTIGANTTLTASANTLTTGTLSDSGFVFTKAGGGTYATTGITLASGATVSSTAGALTSTGVLTLNNGGGTVNATSGTLGYTTITRNAGGVVDFTGTLNNISTTATATAANAIIGGWATVNGGSDFAVVSGGKIAAYSGTTATLPTTGGTNTLQYTLAGSQTQVGNVALNSLKLSNTANSDVLALGASTLTFNSANGGLLYTGGNDNIYTITGTGVIGGGTAGEFIVNTAAGTTLNINAPIVSSTATAGSFTKTGAGTVVLSGASSYNGASNITSGTVKIGVAQVGTTSGALGNGSSALNLASGTTLDLNGNNVTVGAATANSTGTVATVTSASAAALTVAGGSNVSTLNVGGSASLIVNGGTVLSTGTTLITGTGSLGFQNQTGSLRDNNLVTNLGANGSLLFNGTGQIQNTTGQALGAGNAMIINGTGNTWNYQAATSTAGAVTGSGSLTLTNGFNPAFTFSGDLTGFHGSLTLAGSGNGQAIQFTNTTTFSNDANWTLTPTTAPTTAANTSTFMTYTGTGSKTITLGSLSGTKLAGTGAGTGFSSYGVLTNNTAATTATWQIGGANSNTTFAGVIQNGTGTSALTKVGTGSLNLTGANTYTGATVISNGTLFVNGSLASGSAVSIASGGTLGGSGTVAGAVTTAGVGSVVSPGNSPGTLTLGSLDASAGATLVFELGTTSDQLVITGLLTGSTAASGLQFNFSDSGGLLTGNPYTIMTFGSVAGLDYTDFFANTLPSGFFLDSSFGTGGYLINANSLQVQFSTVPEPSTYALLGTGLLSLWALRRKKKV